MGPSQTLKEFQKETTFYQTDLRDILLKQGLITSQYLTCSENNTTKRHLLFEVWRLQCVKKIWSYCKAGAQYHRYLNHLWKYYRDRHANSCDEGVRKGTCTTSQKSNTARKIRKCELSLLGRRDLGQFCCDLWDVAVHVPYKLKKDSYSLATTIQKNADLIINNAIP